MIEHTQRFVDLLYDPDELIALVGLNGGRAYGKTSIGFYRSHAQFARDAARLNGKLDLYVNLCRLNPDLYGRAADRFRTHSPTRFTDAEVIWRPRLCVDLDPVRISGINSTDDELQAAIDLGIEVLEYIEDEWQVGVVPVCSGNGVQLTFRIDEPEDSQLVGNFLNHLDQKYSTPRVKIDTSLSDLSRVIRLPGTLNMKGDHIAERPRRMALCMEVKPNAA